MKSQEAELIGAERRMEVCMDFRGRESVDL
jgi:hypothetical protein